MFFAQNVTRAWHSDKCCRWWHGDQAWIGQFPSGQQTAHVMSVTSRRRRITFVPAIPRDMRRRLANGLPWIQTRRYDRAKEEIMDRVPEANGVQSRNQMGLPMLGTVLAMLVSSGPSVRGETETDPFVRDASWNSDYSVKLFSLVA
jgi:hypothetical protein